MKTANIKFTGEATFSNGEMKFKYFATENAARNWANSQFRKDEEVTVVLYKGFGFEEKFCTYHA